MGSHLPDLWRGSGPQRLREGRAVAAGRGHLGADAPRSFRAGHHLLELPGSRAPSVERRALSGAERGGGGGEAEVRSEA